MIPKKHFKKVAQIIKEARENHGGGTPCDVVLWYIEEHLADNFVDICGSAWFDRDQFHTNSNLDRE